MPSQPEKGEGDGGEAEPSAPTPQDSLEASPTPGKPEAPRHPLSEWGVEYRTHDFQGSKLLSQQQIQALDSLHRKFARSASAALSAYVRSKVQVQLSSIVQRTYSEFIGTLPNPTSLHLVYCLPGRIPFVLEIHPAVLFPMMERLLGGKGNEVHLPSRPLTRIEQTLAGSIARKLLGELRDAWGQDTELSLDLAECEHNPILMQIVGPGEPTLVFTFQTTLGLRTSALNLALPLKPFEELISRLERAGGPRARDGSGGEAEREKVLQRLSSTHLTVSAELPSIPLKIEDILLVRPGDVVDTQIPRGSEVLVMVEGKKVFRGVPVIHEGRRALKLTRCETTD
jgi:flagellar motor switch protein FliM